jgi:hypothetical protein
LVGFVEVSGKDVGVQGGVAVAEDLVVDSECIRAWSASQMIAMSDGKTERAASSRSVR